MCTRVQYLAILTANPCNTEIICIYFFLTCNHEHKLLVSVAIIVIMFDTQYIDKQYIIRHVFLATHSRSGL